MGAKFPNDRFLVPRKDQLPTESDDDYKARLANLLAIQNWINRRPVSAAVTNNGGTFNIVNDSSLTVVTGLAVLWDEYNLVDLTNSLMNVPESGMYIVYVAGIIGIVGPNANYISSLELVGQGAVMQPSILDATQYLPGGGVGAGTTLSAAGVFRVNKPGTLQVNVTRTTGAAGAAGANTLLLTCAAFAKFSEIPSKVQ